MRDWRVVWRCHTTTLPSQFLFACEVRLWSGEADALGDSRRMKRICAHAFSRTYCYIVPYISILVFDLSFFSLPTSHYRYPEQFHF